MKIFILGRTEILIDAAERLVADGHEIAAVVSAPASPEYFQNEFDFEALAERQGARFLLAQKIKGDVLELAQKSGADICISINWVSILQQDFLDIFPLGALNLHFGDLPRYRGNAVTNWAILQGENKIALTVHKILSGQLDAGDILLKEFMPLTEQTTILDINEYARQKAPDMIVKAVTGLEAGTLEVISQKQIGLDTHRCYPRIHRDGCIDWKQSAEKIDALVRSLTKPYAGAYTYLRFGDGPVTRITVWKSRVVETTTEDLGMPGHVIKNDPGRGESWIYTGQGVLALAEISIDDCDDIYNPGNVWNSTRMRLGLNIEDELYRLSSQLESGFET